MSETSPYIYTRWTWFKDYDLAELAPQLKDRFTVVLLNSPDTMYGSTKIGITESVVYDLQVETDTLSAFLAPSRARLFQKKAAPFTRLDVALREAILLLYPHDRESFLPFGFQTEPSFKIEDSKV